MIEFLEWGGKHPWLFFLVLLIVGLSFETMWRAIALIATNKRFPTKRAADGATPPSVEDNVYHVEWIDADTISLTPRR